MVGLALLVLVAKCVDGGTSTNAPQSLVDGAGASASTTTMYVTAASLNCRAEPRASSAVSEKLRRRDEVQAGEVSGDFTHVTTQSSGNCWAATRFLSEEQPAAASASKPAEPSHSAPTYLSEPAPRSSRRRAKSSSSGSCGGKRTCGEMNSCAEAYHYLNQCGLGRLDRDNDGIPCESIC